MRRLLCAVLALVLVVCLLPVHALQVHAASAMKASDDIIQYLKTMEGFTAIPRWDYVQWTVGYGNRCPEEHLERYLKEGIPIEEADALFLEQLVYFEDQVNAFIDRHGLTYSQNQFDAVLSITYNCGAAWLLSDNDLRQAVIEGATGNTLIGIMSQRCTAGGEYLPGLMRRRLTEADIFLNGRYNTQTPENYCYVFYDAGEGKSEALAQGFDCNLYAVPMVTAEREGYTFLGWYTAETGGVKVTYLDENLHQATLYAHWAEGDGSYTGGTTLTPEGVMVTVTGDVVNVRSGPGTSYAVVSSVVKDEKILITMVASDNGGRLWGKTEKGWLCLEYTTYSQVAGDGGNSDSEDTEANEYVAPVYVTIIGGSVTKYNGPDTGYPKIGTISENTEVLIVEFYQMFTTWWGRLEDGGWICINRYVLMHNDQMLAHSMPVTVTNSYLNVRSGPGTSYSWVSSLNQGDTVNILAVETVDSTVWGRFSGGWISLAYTNFDAAQLDYYKNHTFGDWYTVTASTCVTHGTQQRDCLYCDHRESRAADLSGHTYGDWYDVSQGSCVEEGQQRRDCIYCSDYQLQNNGYGDHEYGQWQEQQAPTCTETGLNRRYCQHCDAYEEEIVPAAGHSMGQWYETVAPTLTEYGEERCDCENCDYYETREVAPLEHLFTDWYVVTEASCTENGLERRDCTDCDYFETREIPALGHTYGEWITETEGTCTEGKQEYRECAICGAREEVTHAPAGHAMGQWYVSKAATCEADGEQCRDCANCGYQEIQAITATGHSMGEWVTDSTSTCTQEGAKHRSCIHCDYVETATIAKAEHSFCDWYISIEPTYETPGQERRVCADCGAVETREKAFDGEVVVRTYATITCELLNVRSGPGTGYDWVGTVGHGTVHEVFEQTTVSGKVWARISQGWICITGYASLEEVTEVIAHTHTFGQWYDTVAPTCTESGMQRRDCTGCTHYETQTVSATGHTYGEWYTVTEATEAADGLQRRDCKNCDHYETQVVEYKPATVTKLYGTLTGNSYLRIRAGLGVNYAEVGKLYYGERVEILEIGYIGSQQWGRIDRGWICITGYITLEEVEEVVGHTHSYGEWYTVTEATCTTDGEKRRDCACGRSETESIPATGHTFGEWYTVTEATADANGLERRDCACGHYEERETVYQAETVTKIYGTLTGYDYLNIRAGLGTSYAIVGQLVRGERVEILEIVQYGIHQWGRIDRGWVQLTGYVTLEEVEEPVTHTHSYGEWYTVTEATADANGLERRDCACGHYEERETVYQAETVTKIYGTLTGYDYLNIRAGLGTSYAIVGQLVRGERVEILEIVQYGIHQWGRIDRGWVQLTGYVTLEEVEEPVDGEAGTNAMTVQATVLNVRAGAGTNYSIVTSLVYGTEVIVLETKMVNGTAWARIDLGWVSMTYLG